MKNALYKDTAFLQAGSFQVFRYDQVSHVGRQAHRCYVTNVNSNSRSVLSCLVESSAHRSNLCRVRIERDNM